MTTGSKKSRFSNVSCSLALQQVKSLEKYHIIESSGTGTYPIIQQKGQRRYGPPKDWTEEPPRGSEIHVSKLPRDMLEDELIPVFEKAGKIFDIRLMMETSENNKGYAFIKFCFREASEIAISQLNEYEIRPNVYINVRRSIDNNRLFIGNIPKNYSTEDVLQSMKEVSTGVLKVILYASVNDRTKNRGYGFVEFDTHQQAKNTRNKLKLCPLIWSGQEVKVDWAEPEPEVDEETMKKVRILYVRNLALSTTDQQLRDLFSRFGGTIERVKKIKDYAFIHFSTREQAEITKNKLQGYELDKCEIDISWSKPVTNREEYQQRKAASKALSSGQNIQNAMHTTFCLNGEPILLNQRVRTAAGAQGYNASRPYPIRPKQNEESFSSFQGPFMYPNFAYIQDMTVRNSLDSYGVATVLPQTVYNPEGTNQIDDFLSQQQDAQYHIASPATLQRYPHIITSPYSVVTGSSLNNCWGTQPFIHPGTTTPSLLSTSPYVISAPSYAPVPGTYSSAHAFFGGQMMTQIPSVTGSNMSIDRT